MTSADRTPIVLSIAGSDSGGGAGIQADLKAFARCGTHGTSAITAITAQNTTSVNAIHPVPVEIIRAQIEAVLSDMHVGAIKVGMLATAEITHAVAVALDLTVDIPIVVDPVMVSESGARLLRSDAQRAIVEQILPRATVLTPNLPEAYVLAGFDEKPLSSAQHEEKAHEIERLAGEVLALGCEAVVLTGGHRSEAVDLFMDASQTVTISGERHDSDSAHGSGCTHSSVLAAQLALGNTPLRAAEIARELAGQAVALGLRDVGHGAGPVDIVGLGAIRQQDASCLS